MHRVIAAKCVVLGTLKRLIISGNLSCFTSCNLQNMNFLQGYSCKRHEQLNKNGWIAILYNGQTNKCSYKKEGMT